MVDLSLARAFVAGLPGDVVPDPALAEALAAALASARETFPSLAIDPLAFAAYLAERAPLDVAGAERLKEIETTDLYLACGCAEGNAEALRLFEERHLAGVDGALAQLRSSSELVAEIKQMLRERLLVGVAGTGPKIREYGGRGALRSWVRVAAVRAALMALRKGRREIGGLDDRLAAIAAPGDDPELEHLKRRYRGELEVALREALTSLTDRERNVLRQHFLYGLTLEQVGALYRVHRASAARWIAAARDKLFHETRRSLSRRLELSPPELESLFRLIESRMDVSLGGLLE